MLSLGTVVKINEGVEGVFEDYANNYTTIINTHYCWDGVTVYELACLTHVWVPENVFTVVDESVNGFINYHECSDFESTRDTNETNDCDVDDAMLNLKDALVNFLSEMGIKTWLSPSERDLLLSLSDPNKPLKYYKIVRTLKNEHEWFMGVEDMSLTVNEVLRTVGYSED